MKKLMDSDNVGRDMWEKRKSFPYLFLKVTSSDKPHQNEKGLLLLIIVNNRIAQASHRSTYLCIGISGKTRIYIKNEICLTVKVFQLSSTVFENLEKNYEPHSCFILLLLLYCIQ